MILVKLCNHKNNFSHTNTFVIFVQLFLMKAISYWSHETVRSLSLIDSNSFIGAYWTVDAEWVWTLKASIYNTAQIKQKSHYATWINCHRPWNWQNKGYDTLSSLKKIFLKLCTCPDLKLGWPKPRVCVFSCQCVCPLTSVGKLIICTK